MILPIDELLGAQWQHNPEFDEPADPLISAQEERLKVEKMDAYQQAHHKREAYERYMVRRELRAKLHVWLP